MTIRIVRYAALLVTMLYAGHAQSDVAVDFVSRIALSPDGRFVAILESGSGDERVTLFRATDRQQLLTLQTSDFSSFLDGPSIDDLAWSADGSFLKIEISDGDLEHRVLVIRPRQRSSPTLLQTASGPVVAARWAASGSSVFAIVAAKDPEDYPSALVKLDVLSGATKVILADRPVTAILSVSTQRLLVKVPYEHTRKLPAAIVEILLPSHKRRTFLTVAGDTK